MPTVPRELTRVPVVKDTDFEDRWNAMPPGIRDALQSIEDRRNEFSDTLMSKEKISQQSGKLYPPSSEGAMLSWNYKGDVPPHTKLSIEAGSKDIKAPSKEDMMGFFANVESLNPDPEIELKKFEEKIHRKIQQMQPMPPGIQGALKSINDWLTQEKAPQMVAPPLGQGGPTEAERARGINLLKNEMWNAIDPMEGDFFRAEAYNTTKAAEGIRKYKGDR